MNAKRNFVAYFDLLGVGDSSEDDRDQYYAKLLEFKTAICQVVDVVARDGDEVYAFSDCAFLSSASLGRIFEFVSEMQNSLWYKSINFKGAVCASPNDVIDFAHLPEGGADANSARSRRLRGYWFGAEFVRPALLEKGLKGIGFSVDKSLWNYKIVRKKAFFSAYYPSDGIAKPVVFMDLVIPPKNLRPLEGIITNYLLTGHRSRRIAKYYVSLILTWIKSHDYASMAMGEAIDQDSFPLPYRQLVGNQDLAKEILAMVGSDLIYYALLSRVSETCRDESVKMHLVEWIGASKKLRSCADSIPDEICARPLRNQVIERRVDKLVSTSKKAARQ